MKSNLAKVFEVLEGEIPEDFVAIANDPGGNEILLEQWDIDNTVLCRFNDFQHTPLIKIYPDVHIIHDNSSLWVINQRGIEEY